MKKRKVAFVTRKFENKIVIDHIRLIDKPLSTRGEKVGKVSPARAYFTRGITFAIS